MTRSVICRRVLNAVVAATILHCCAAGAGSGATVWVNGDTGDDTHTGTTPIDALRTLERGIVVCRAVKCSSLLLRGELRLNTTASFGEGLDGIMVGAWPGASPATLKGSVDVAMLPRLDSMHARRFDQHSRIGTAADASADIKSASTTYSVLLPANSEAAQALRRLPGEIYVGKSPRSMVRTPMLRWERTLAPGSGSPENNLGFV